MEDFFFCYLSTKSGPGGCRVYCPASWEACGGPESDNCVPCPVEEDRTAEHVRELHTLLFGPNKEEDESKKDGAAARSSRELLSAMEGTIQMLEETGEGGDLAALRLQFERYQILNRRAAYNDVAVAAVRKELWKKLRGLIMHEVKSHVSEKVHKVGREYVRHAAQKLIDQFNRNLRANA